MKLCHGPAKDLPGQWPFSRRALIIKEGGTDVLDWNKVACILDEKKWLTAFSFELQFLGYSDGVYDSRMGRIVWEVFVRSLPDPGSLPVDETIRDGWHFTRDTSNRWAVLTSVDAHANGRLDRPVPMLPMDPLPPTLCGIAMNPRFIEDVILDRRYPRPATCYDAVTIILRAWEDSSCDWTPTLRTIDGVRCVIL